MHLFIFQLLGLCDFESSALSQHILVILIVHDLAGKEEYLSLYVRQSGGLSLECSSLLYSKFSMVVSYSLFLHSSFPKRSFSQLFVPGILRFLSSTKLILTAQVSADDGIISSSPASSWDRAVTLISVP